jgi:hypothetical protein
MEWKNAISLLNTTAECLVKLPFRDQAEAILKEHAKSYKEVVIGDFSLLGTVHEYKILNGTAFRNRVFAWPTPGLWIDGANVVRFILDQLNIPQPDLLPGESECPDIEDLRQRVQMDRKVTDAKTRREEEAEGAKLAEYDEFAAQFEEDCKRAYCGTPSNYEGLNGYEVFVLREVECAAKLHRTGYLDEAQESLKKAIGLRKELDSEITPWLKYKRQFGETKKMMDLRLHWDPTGVMGRRRKYSPWVINTTDEEYSHCGVWAPTFVKEFREGKRPGRTWGNTTLIEVTDEDYENWPYLIRAYPDRPDTIPFGFYWDHVKEWPGMYLGPDW